MKQCAPTKVWQTIVAEAREQAEQEPMLASFTMPLLLSMTV